MSRKPGDVAMLAAERGEKIVQIVNGQGSVRVSELSEMFGVTEETIRRDLDRLEREGRLKRSHGGAISLREPQLEVPYSEREVTNVAEKQRIARRAVELVEEHDFIILDASSTAWYMADALPDMPLTVLTNSIKVALELAAKEKIRLISTGGILSPRSLSYVGPLAEQSLDRYHVAKAFISCKGLHVDRGLSESNELQARIKQKMMSIADTVYVLADHTKFGVQSFAFVEGYERVSGIITDSGVDRTHTEAFTKKKVEVIVV